MQEHPIKGIFSGLTFIFRHLIRVFIWLVCCFQFFNHEIHLLGLFFLNASTAFVAISTDSFEDSVFGSFSFIFLHPLNGMPKRPFATRSERSDQARDRGFGIVPERHTMGTANCVYVFFEKAMQALFQAFEIAVTCEVAGARAKGETG